MKNNSKFHTFFSTENKTVSLSVNEGFTNHALAHVGKSSKSKPSLQLTSHLFKGVRGNIKFQDLLIEFDIKVYGIEEVLSVIADYLEGHSMLKDGVLKVGHISNAFFANVGNNTIVIKVYTYYVKNVLCWQLDAFPISNRPQSPAQQLFF